MEEIRGQNGNPPPAFVAFLLCRRGNNGGGDDRRKGGKGSKAPAEAGRGVTVSSVPGTTLDFLKARFVVVVVVVVFLLPMAGVGLVFRSWRLCFLVLSRLKSSCCSFGCCSSFSCLRAIRIVFATMTSTSQSLPSNLNTRSMIVQTQPTDAKLGLVASKREAGQHQ